MISKARVKYIKSLQVKKYRKEEQLFLVEGAKSVLELLQSDFTVTLVVGTESFLDEHHALLSRSKTEMISSTEKELSSIGTFQSNDGALAIARMKPNKAPIVTGNEIVLVLDDIRDPGNLGTIIRTADWYGVKNIIASEETAEFYNPKTISATMGSFSRIAIYYSNLVTYLSTTSPENIYGAFLDGKNIHKISVKTGIHLVIGNESHGISEQLEKFIGTRVTIPAFGKAESLNAGVATAVLLDNFRRLQK